MWSRLAPKKYQLSETPHEKKGKQIFFPDLKKSSNFRISTFFQINLKLVDVCSLQVQTHDLFTETFLGRDDRASSGTKPEDSSKRKFGRSEDAIADTSLFKEKDEEEKDVGEVRSSLLTLRMAPKYFIPARSFVPSELQKLEV